MSYQSKRFVAVTVDNDDKTHVHFMVGPDDRKVEFMLHQDFPDRDVENVVPLPLSWQEESHE